MSTPLSDFPLATTYPTHPQAIVLPILASIACVLCVPLLIVHIRARNFALVVLILNFTLLNLQNIINPILWHNDDTESWWSGHILCDIEAKLQVGVSIIIPGAATCLGRQLALILNTSHVTSMTPSTHGRRIRLIFEITLCIVLPVYLMSVHVRVQPYRYYIFSIAGCQCSLDVSILAIVLVLVWPVLVCLLGTAYNIAVVIRLVRHRRQVSSLLARSGSSASRFTRLFVIATLFLAVCTPLSIYNFVQCLDTFASASPWNEVHPPDWSTLIIKRKSDPSALRDRWIQLATAYLIAGVFGSASDVLSMYRRWATVIANSFCGSDSSRQARRGSRGPLHRFGSLQPMRRQPMDIVESSIPQEGELVMHETLPEVQASKSDFIVHTTA